MEGGESLGAWLGRRRAGAGWPRVTEDDSENGGSVELLCAGEEGRRSWT